MAEITVSPEQESSFRWVMMVVCTIVMACGFIPMTAFGVMAPGIAKTVHVSLTKLSIWGGDAFNLGIFAAFIPGHSGWFDKKPKVGVAIAGILAVVPQLLMPVAGSLWAVSFLRFFQGFVIMVLALFSFQLAGWFRPSERGISLGSTVGAIVLGAGALGGWLANLLAPLGWRAASYVLAAIIVFGFLVYFIVAKDAPTFMKSVLVAKEKESVHHNIWGLKMSWIMGLVQVPLCWVLFTTGAFVPLYAMKLGYSAHQAGNLMVIWGIGGFVISVLGSRLGDQMCKGKATHREVLNARLKIIIAGNIVMGLSALLYITIGHLGFGAMVVTVLFNAAMWLIPPNYWATPGTVFPVALMGAGAFAMGLISNAGSPIGSFISSGLLPALGWNGVFILMAAICFVGIFINIWAMKTPLPSEDPKYTAQ